MHILLAASAVCATFLSSASGLVITGKEASVGRSLAAGWSYYGCAEMPPFVRATIVDEGGMTPEICARYCQDKHYTAAGLSDGNACHCWDGLSTGWSLLADAECSLPCSGDSRESCGGRDALSVLVSINPPASIELRSAPVQKRKCKGGKPSMPSYSAPISSSASYMTQSTVSSYSVTPISTSTSSPFVSESTSSILSWTSSSDDAPTITSSATSSSTVSEVSPTMTSSELTATESSGTISETSTSATSSEDVTTTSSSTTSDVPTSTTSSEVVIESSSTTSTETTTTESSTVTSETSSSTTSADVTTTTSSSISSEISTSATATGPCATITALYVLQGSGTGDFAVDGNFAALQSAFGSGYRVSFSANRQNAQQFRFQPDCTFTTADGGLLAMIGGTANLHSQYFFPSVQAASALINVNWEADDCTKNADNTLACTAMQQSIFQVTLGYTWLELGDQNYGEEVTINLVPIQATSF